MRRKLCNFELVINTARFYYKAASYCLICYKLLTGSHYWIFLTKLPHAPLILRITEYLRMFASDFRLICLLKQQNSRNIQMEAEVIHTFASVRLNFLLENVSGCFFWNMWRKVGGCVKKPKERRMSFVNGP